ncbi:MAG: RsbRD N-terminal domain-containing protein [Planctomycetota bacterium]
MTLQDLLEEKKAAILERWRERVLATYPEASAPRWQRGQDRFRDPVGHTIQQGTEGVVAALVANASREELVKRLEDIVRLRAVQDFTPSQAVAFVFSLKGAVRETLSGIPESPSLAQELQQLEARIDEIALAAFDLYMGCREKIMEIRVNETRNRFYKLLERAGGGLAGATGFPAGEARRDPKPRPNGRGGSE